MLSILSCGKAVKNKLIVNRVVKTSFRHALQFHKTLLAKRSTTTSLSNEQDFYQHPRIFIVCYREF